jgi:hypothetical protein
LPPQAGQPSQQQIAALAGARRTYRRRSSQPSPVDIKAATLDLWLQRHEALIYEIANLPETATSRGKKLRRIKLTALAAIEAIIARRTL